MAEIVFPPTSGGGGGQVISQVGTLFNCTQSSTSTIHSFSLPAGNWLLSGTCLLRTEDSTPVQINQFANLIFGISLSPTLDISPITSPGAVACPLGAMPNIQTNGVLVGNIYAQRYIELASTTTIYLLAEAPALTAGIIQCLGMCLANKIS